MDDNQSQYEEFLEWAKSQEAYNLWATHVIPRVKTSYKPSWHWSLYFNQCFGLAVNWSEDLVGVSLPFVGVIFERY